MYESYMVFDFASGRLTDVTPLRNIPSDFSELKTKLKGRGYQILTSEKRDWGVPISFIVFGESRKQIRTSVNSITREVNLPFDQGDISDFIRHR